MRARTRASITSQAPPPLTSASGFMAPIARSASCVKRGQTSRRPLRRARDLCDSRGRLPLPLLERATPDGLTFALTRRNVSALRLPAAAGVALRESGPPSRRLYPIAGGGLMPSVRRVPASNARFHFDMKKCIGCKCCVVACNEQNGNPAAINWRRVGEIEGGWFPRPTRSYLSMGCNHCLEPTCLSGCPVDAYTKDP